MPIKNRQLSFYPRGAVFLTAMILLAIFVIFSAGFFYWKFRSARPINMSDLEVVKKVGEMMVLPSGEEPVVITIDNADELSAEQPFYRDAKNGDKVLIFLQSKKAVIFDPLNNMIVNAGPVSSQ